MGYDRHHNYLQSEEAEAAAAAAVLHAGPYVMQLTGCGIRKVIIHSVSASLAQTDDVHLQRGEVEAAASVLHAGPHAARLGSCRAAVEGVALLAAQKRKW